MDGLYENSEKWGYTLFALSTQAVPEFTSLLAGAACRINRTRHSLVRTMGKLRPPQVGEGFSG
ncbi:MAG: hypothetical protein LBD59_03520 [Prevotellaceae bacterium]|nr:hypothetical protein [Prevotellaceae bacterium]